MSCTQWKRELRLNGKGKEGSRELALRLFPSAADLLKWVYPLSCQYVSPGIHGVHCTFCFDLSGSQESTTGAWPHACGPLLPD